MRARRSTRGRQGKRAGYRPPPAARIHPLPWAIDPDRDWQVREWRPGAGDPPHVLRDGDIAVIATPFDQSEASRAIRQHEMAHVKWTPASPSLEGCHPFTVNAVEDCRIHKRLKEQSFDRPAVLGPADIDRFKQGISSGKLSPLDTARYLVACINTGDEKPFRRMLESLPGTEWIAAIADEAYKRHMKPRRPAWRKTIDMSRELEAAFMPPPPPDPADTLPGGFTAGDADLDEVEESFRADYGAEFGRQGRWGTMTEEHPPLTVPMPRAFRSRRNRPSDTGAVPRYWDRLASDGRVFVRKEKRPGGGAVLIDQSGSMSLSADEVLALLVALPAAVIATYAGDHDTGSLIVIARNGKRVADHLVHHPDGGNTVDGPALEWLAAQPGPRYWVSDGQVVGAGGAVTANLVRDARDICRRGRIARVESAEALIGRLADAGALTV